MRMEKFSEAESRWNGGCGCAAFKRAEDLHFRAGREAPGDADAHGKNHQSDDSVDGILQIKKWRSESEQSEVTDGCAEAVELRAAVGIRRVFARGGRP